MGRAARLAVTATREAVSSAGLRPAEVEAGRLGITVGTTMGETDFIEDRLDAAENDWLSAEHMRNVYQSDPGHFDEVLESCTSNILDQVQELQQISALIR